MFMFNFIILYEENQENLKTTTAPIRGNSFAEYVRRKQRQIRSGLHVDNQR